MTDRRCAASKKWLNPLLLWWCWLQTERKTIRGVAWSILNVYAVSISNRCRTLSSLFLSPFVSTFSLVFIASLDGGRSASFNAVVSTNALFRVKCRILVVSSRLPPIVLFFVLLGSRHGKQVLLSQRYREALDGR